jgi:hypothetical protein
MKNKLKVYDLTVTNYDFTGYILMPDDRTLDVEGGVLCHLLRSIPRRTLRRFTPCY